MPKVLSQNGVSVYVYSGDHPPPHCHCKTGGDGCVIQLSEGGVSVMHPCEKASNTKKCLTVVQDNQALILAEWNRLNT